jgi:hypothetical protein
VRVHVAAKHAPQFEPPDALLQRSGLAFDVLRGPGIVLALGESEQL